MDFSWKEFVKDGDSWWRMTITRSYREGGPWPRGAQGWIGRDVLEKLVEGEVDKMIDDEGEGSERRTLQF